MKTVKNVVSFVLVILLAISTIYAKGKKDQPAPATDEYATAGTESAPKIIPLRPIELVDFKAGKYRLAVLPFIGLDAEVGEMLAWELGNLEDMRLDFSVVPLTPNMLRYVKEEQQIQRVPNPGSLGIPTVSSTRPEAGRQFDSDFAVVGIVRTIGGQNILCILILDVRTGQQMAGDFRIFTTPDTISHFLPDMAKKLVTAAKRNTRTFPRMAIRPFAVPAGSGITEADADFITQLLAADMANNGPYQVYPRTANIDMVLTQLQNQNPRMITVAKEFTNRQNTEYILGVKIGKINATNRMYGEITRVDNNILKIGAQVSYENMTDSFARVSELGMKLIVDNRS
jgi:hypothetical protein